MRAGASLRAKKSASVRTGRFFTLRSARSIFGGVHAAAENDFNLFRREAAKLCEAIFDKKSLAHARDFSLLGRVGVRVGYQYTYSAQKRYSIAASWARVALPPGSRLPAPVPLMMPSPQAHCRASKAYSLMLRASL